MTAVSTVGSGLQDVEEHVALDPEERALLLGRDGRVARRLVEQAALAEVVARAEVGDRRSSWCTTTPPSSTA